MKTNGLPSHGTILPTMFCQCVMTNKEAKKIQFGGWNKRRYKEIRKLLKVREEKDLNIKLK
jgi:hypothetical protein